MGLKIWRVFCTTDQIKRIVEQDIEDPTPTKCPDNPGHTIDDDRTFLQSVKLFGYEHLYLFADGSMVLDNNGEPYLRGDLDI